MLINNVVNDSNVPNVSIKMVYMKTWIVHNFTSLIGEQFKIVKHCFALVARKWQSKTL